MDKLKFIGILLASVFMQGCNLEGFFEKEEGGELIELESKYLLPAMPMEIESKYLPPAISVRK